MRQHEKNWSTLSSVAKQPTTQDSFDRLDKLANKSRFFAKITQKECSADGEIVPKIRCRRHLARKISFILSQPRASLGWTIFVSKMLE